MGQVLCNIAHTKRERECERGGRETEGERQERERERGKGRKRGR